MDAAAAGVGVVGASVVPAVVGVGVCAASSDNGLVFGG